MNSAVGVLTVIATGMAIIGGGIRAISRLTRIADSVERLSASMQQVVGQIGDQEKRITRLEDHEDHPQ